jgi:hypothetical protein
MSQNPRGAGVKTDKPNGRPSLMLVVGLLVTAAALIGCAADKHLQFTEQVLLASGEVLIVNRDVKSSPLGEIGGPGGWEAKYMSLEIVGPKNSDNPPRWESEAGLVPIVFDRDPVTKEWTLLATFYTCDAWYGLGKPKLPYAEFHTQGGSWQRRELSPQWIGHTANLLTSINSGGEPKLISLAIKQQKMSDPTIAPEYRSIVGKWSTGC